MLNLTFWSIKKKLINLKDLKHVLKIPEKKSVDV